MTAVGTPPSVRSVPGATSPCVRVLLVDDSAAARGAVARMLAATPDLHVVGTAGDGRQALALLARKPADVVVLDVEMPEMDGLAALPRILEAHPATQVLMLSAHGGRGAAITMRALALGAADFVCKPGPGTRAGLAALAEELRAKVRSLGHRALRAAEVSRAARAPLTIGTESAAAVGGPGGERASGDPGRTPPLGLVPGGRPRRVWNARPARVLVVGSSTGGPAALAAFLGALPPRLHVPVLITQHMPPTFTRLLAERLTAASQLQCAEARDGEVLVPGRVYIAPGDHHLQVARRGTLLVAALTQDPPVNHCRPAADPMFTSAAQAYGAGTLGVVLTGMGHDGREGAAAIVRAGGRVLAQDEASSVVWGMPGAVVQAGLADAIHPVPQLAALAASACAAVARPTPSEGSELEMRAGVA